jgi:hypothetical protein
MKLSLGTNHKIDFVFVVVAEINDVVAAVAATPFITQALGMEAETMSRQSSHTNNQPSH